MTRRHKLVLALMMPVTLALVALLAAAFTQPVPSLSINTASPQFDIARVLTDTAKLTADFPDRLTGSPAGARARAWIVERFGELGLKVETLPFTVTVASEVLAGEQVWATSPGARDDSILITAHYDDAPARVADAMHNASGIAALLELARIFSGEAHTYTFIFMASDASMYGPAWGAQNFIQHFDARSKIVAVLELGDMGAQAVGRIRVSGVGLRQGYTPLWMRQIAFTAIEAAGSHVDEPDGVTEYLQRAFPLGAADYATFLRAGIPAIRFGGQPGGVGSRSAEDQSAQAGLAGYGRAVELWLRAVDALDPLPSSTTHYFRLDRARFLAGDALDYLQILLFTPLFLAAGMAWQKERPRLDELQPEFTACLGLVITGLDGYAVAYSLVALKLLPAYEMFPATAGDPFLLRPGWWAALVIYATVALFGWLIFRPYRGWGRLADLLQIPYRRATLLLVFSALVVVVWFLNGFAASALLGPAAYLWPLIEPRRGLWGKALNAALALTGLAPLAVCVALFFPAAAFGPWWWFLPLGAAYGFFPFLGVIAFICGAALLLRFLRLGLRDPEMVFAK